MATWANALSEHKLDIVNGGPAIVWEIVNHEISADAEEDFQTNRIDVRHKTSTKLVNSGVTVSAGTGVPKIYAVYFDEANNQLAEMELAVGENIIAGRFMKLRVKETNSNTATYSALIRMS